MTKSLEQPGRQTWYVAPCYAQAFAVFRALNFEPALRSFIAESRMQPFPEVSFFNGSRVGFRSFDRPDNLRGAGLDEVDVDEIQDINENDFWPVINPLVADRDGTILIAGQFRGLNWYYEKLWLPGQKPENLKTYRSWVFPSDTGLAFQSEKGRERLELLRQTMPKVQFDQEVMCIPVANQAAVFNYEDLKAIQRGSPSPPVPGCRYILAMDLGRIVDPSAVVVMEDKSAAVVHAEKFPLGMKHEEQAKRLDRLRQTYSASVIIDSTGGATGGRTHVDAYVAEYRRVIPDLHEFKWTTDSKTRLIQNLCVAVEKRQISAPKNFEELHREMAWYEFRHSNGVYRYSAPEGKHDDYVAALAMAWWGRQQRILPDPTLRAMPLGV